MFKNICITISVKMLLYEEHYFAEDCTEQTVWLERKKDTARRQTGLHQNNKTNNKNNKNINNSTNKDNKQPNNHGNKHDNRRTIPITRGKPSEILEALMQSGG